MVTENGCDVPNESALSPAASLKDAFRLRYFSGYLAATLQAKHRDDVNLQVRGAQSHKRVKQ